MAFAEVLNRPQSDVPDAKYTSRGRVDATGKRSIGRGTALISALCGEETQPVLGESHVTRVTAVPAQGPRSTSHRRLGSRAHAAHSPVDDA